MNTAVALAFEPHPATHAGRQLGRVESDGGRTVVDLLRDAGIDPNATFYAWHNDRLLTAEEWDTVCPRPGDMLSVKAALEGGGGGSNPIKIIASIALAVYAPGLGEALYAAAGGTYVTASAATMIAVSGAVVSVAGSMLINALMPAPKPGLSNAAAKTASASPTYSLSGGSNRARPFEPLPLVLGVHRMFPDLAAVPFSRYIAQEQYLYMLFDFGFGDLKIEDLRIGDNPLSNYPDIEVYRSGGAASGIPQFAGNVDTTPGAELTYNTPVTRTSSTSTRRLEIDLMLMMYKFSSTGELTFLTMTIKAEYRPVGSGTWLNFWPGTGALQTHYWSKGFYATERVETLDVDGNVTVSDVAAVWHQVAHGSNVAGDHVDGAAAGTYETPDGTTVALTWRWLAYADVIDVNGHVKWPAPPREPDDGPLTQTFRRGSVKPSRITYGRDVAVGQYEVRLTQMTAAPTSTQEAATATWQSLRSVQVLDEDFSGRNLLGLRMKATATLNGVVQQLSALVSHSLDAIVPGAWTWGRSLTRNPAWLFLALARGKRLSDYTGNPDDSGMAWGAGLPAARIDLAAIVGWSVFCEAQKLTCSLVIDRPLSIAEALQTIARCGRATPTWASGMLGVVWDAPDQPIVAVFGMSNIIRDTFQVHYVSDRLTEEVVVQFVNPDLGWQQDTVRALVPGVVHPTRTTTIELMGCTSRDQAGREANLIAAAQFYRRRQIVWEADFEGLVVQRGDVVLLSHDLTQWSYSGRLTDAGSAVLKLDRTVPRNGAVEYVGVRKPDGSFAVYDVIAGTAGTDSDTLQLVASMGFNPMADPQGHPVWDYLWFFSPLATPGKKVKITDIRPLSDSRVRISATDEDPDYYTAEDGTYEHTVPASTAITPAVVSLAVVESLVAYGLEWRPSAAIEWATVNALATRMRYQVGTEDWVAAGIFGPQERFVLDAVAQGVSITAEVTPIGAGGVEGATISATATISGSATPIPPALASATATSQLFSVRLNWTFANDRQGVAAVRILGSTTNNVSTATELATVVSPANTWTHHNLTKSVTQYYWLYVIDMLGRASAAVTASAAASTSQAALLSQLAGGITTGELATALSTQISGDHTDITNIKGLYTVKMSSGGQVSGFGLMSSLAAGGSPTSTFLVAADLFAVIAPTAAGFSSGDARSVPLAVLTSTQTINGVSFPAGVYINGGVISARSLETIGMAENALSQAYWFEAGSERQYSTTPYVENADIQVDANISGGPWDYLATSTKIGRVDIPISKQTGDTAAPKFLVQAMVQVHNNGASTGVFALGACLTDTAGTLGGTIVISSASGSGSLNSVPRLANAYVPAGQLVTLSAHYIVESDSWAGGTTGRWKNLLAAKRSGDNFQIYRTHFSVLPLKR